MTRAVARFARVGLAVAAPLLAAQCGGFLVPDERSDDVIIQAIAGNHQISRAGSALSAPVTVRVSTSLGRPLSGIELSWQATDDGRLAPERLVTDGSGTARAAWTLGEKAGPQYATASLRGHELRLHARAVDPLTLGSREPLLLDAADGIAEFVHPDVASVPAGWGTGSRFLTITPYVNGNFADENPWIFTSGARARWSPPDGLANPVARPRRGHLSDPDIVFEPELGELWLYYRHVSRRNTILLRRSADGTNWTRPQRVLSAPNHEIISPAVVRLAPGVWHMWSVNAGIAGCMSESATVEHRTSSDGMHWGTPERVDLGEADAPPWHLDVLWVPERAEFWALYNAKPRGNCATPALFIATSSDGIHWQQYPTPVLARGTYPPLNDVVYRSTLEYDAASDVVTIWFSGARVIGETWLWSTAVQRIRRTDLFRVAATKPLLRSLIDRRPLPRLFRAP